MRGELGEHTNLDPQHRSCWAGVLPAELLQLSRNGCIPLARPHELLTPSCRPLASILARRTIPTHKSPLEAVKIADRDGRQ